ncbi:hypothetical protein EV421DRAFT_1723119 [Armillaria borealis]|uniref:Uncharacterized protein n=1 Tax=Armillaria borealis TaxID=47425 RepID=A0AA39ISB5_9AGAR|nr:hypothetical protein EV421DRAFT_1723119 [Armillaria borealis]
MQAISIGLTSSSPICAIPFLSDISLCRRTSMTGSGHIMDPVWVDYLTLIHVQDTVLEGLLDDSTGALVLSLTLKRAEMAIQDVAILVRSSNLINQEQIAQCLKLLVQSAKRSSHGVLNISFEAEAAIKGAIAMHEYAFDSIRHSHAIAYRRSTVDGVVLKQFTYTLDYLFRQVNRLIPTYQSQISALMEIETHLDTLHGLINRDGILYLIAKEDVLAELWSMLTCERPTVSSEKIQKNFALLDEYGSNRHSALVTAGSGLAALQGLMHGVQDVRKRMSHPSPASPIPV